MCPLRISTVPLRQLAPCWPLPTGAHCRVIGQNTDEVQSQPVIMGDVSPGGALRASHKPWKWLGLTSSRSNYCFSFGGPFTAFWGIIMSLASYRHERINTRKTLIIESCPDDDLVNLEFLDEVRFNMFISSCIDRAKAQWSWCYVCCFLFSSGDNNQPPPEEIWWAAGVHLRWWHPHRSQSFPEPQHLLSAGWLWTSHKCSQWFPQSQWKWWMIAHQ